MPRLVEPEILDQLPAENPEARASRSDLTRINRLMGHARLLRRALPSHATCVVDLGAGDGTLLLDMIQRRPAIIERVVLVDQQQVVDETTLAQFRREGIEAEIVVADVFEWLDQFRRQQPTAMIANLFLHHFQDAELKTLFDLICRSCDAFLGCEPRRGAWPAFAVSLLAVIGCNRVTRHDARLSVRAGFRNHELSALWPDHESWDIQELEAGLFSHFFAASKKRT
jgi:hypothetical protein